MLLPQIKTERLILRMYRADNMEMVYNLCSDADITKFFPSYYTADREDILGSLPRRLERWRTQGFGQCGVFDKLEEKLIGYCGMQYLDNTEEVEIYYGFFRDFWGKGLATEAARAMLRFGFEQVNLKKIVAVTHLENTTSHNVLGKLGFERGADKMFYKTQAAYFTLAAENYQPGAEFYELNFQEV